jgi:hypothetical protein
MFSEDKPHLERVERGVIYARRWVDRQPMR